MDSAFWEWGGWAGVVALATMIGTLVAALAWWQVRRSNILAEAANLPFLGLTYEPKTETLYLRNTGRTPCRRVDVTQWHPMVAARPPIVKNGVSVDGVTVLLTDKTEGDLEGWEFELRGLDMTGRQLPPRRLRFSSAYPDRFIDLPPE